MDSFGDIVKEIKGRVVNPFISSSIIFWIILNWRILVILFWFDQEMLYQNEYSSYSEAIEKNLSLYRSYILPFILGLIYVVTIQFIKHQIDIWLLKIERYFSIRKKDIAEEIYLPQDQIIIRENNLEKREEELKKKEGSYSKLEQQIEIQKKDIKELKTDKEKLEKRSTTNPLENAVWMYKQTDITGETKSVRILVENSTWYEINKEGRRTYKYKMIFGYFNESEMNYKAIMVDYRGPNDKTSYPGLIFFLDIDVRFEGEYKGKVNSKIEVKFNKVNE